MIEVLEIWSNNAGTEFAVKISGQSSFMQSTDPDAKYTHVVYAVPYLEGYIDDVKKQLEKVLEKERQQSKKDGGLGHGSYANRNLDL